MAAATLNKDTTMQLIPEWYPSDAVILAWPHRNTDWASWLVEAQDTYLTLINAINEAAASVILLCREQELDDARQRIPTSANVMLVVADYNDTWARDYAFLTCKDQQGLHHPIEFTFNGWGQKFNAAKDNLVNRTFLAPLCNTPLHSHAWVAEGGALEINDDGELLSTASCLLNPLRNGEMKLSEYQQIFKETLGATRVCVFQHGHLEGDDTDGHIDTLVRFTPDNNLVIQAADNRPDDSHFAGLSALVTECKSAYPEAELFTLPLPHIVNGEGERLPASYANYLICNDSVLVPIYQQPEDQETLTILQRAYPKHKIVAVDCSVLVRQFGSLHCVTMQVPQSTLREDVLAQLKQGVTLYAAE